MIDVLLTALLIAINVWILVYLYNLERMGCTCAMDWRRQYIMVYIAVGLVVWMLQLIDVSMFTSPAILTLWTLLSIVNVVAVLTYVRELDQRKCECSKSVERSVLTAIHILYALVYLFVLVFFLYMAFSISQFVRSQSADSKKNFLRMMKNLKRVAKAKANA